MSNNENETVRETLERVMREKGYLKPENQTTLKKSDGDFNSVIEEQTPINYSAMQNNTSLLDKTPMQPDYTQPASLRFDGKNLIWLQNGKPVKYWEAMSGHDNFQGSQYTNVPYDGPIPQGDWILKKDSGEYHKPGEWRTFDEFISNTGVWKKFPDAWGNSRIPIQPLPETNTYGRTNMYIHGGDVPGSAGCIDLTYHNDDFYNDFKNYNDDLPLKVKYRKNW